MAGTRVGESNLKERDTIDSEVHESSAVRKTVEGLVNPKKCGPSHCSSHCSSMRVLAAIRARGSTPLAVMLTQQTPTLDSHCGRTALIDQFRAR